MSDRSAEVANTILQQLGGSRFRTMTGARDLTHGDAIGKDETAYLRMKIMRNARKVTHVDVILTERDDYKLVFYKWDAKKLLLNEISRIDNVYAENLRSSFTAGTGLQTSLAA